MRNPVARHLAQSRRRSSVVPNKKWFPTKNDWVEEQLEMFDDEDPFNTWKAEVDRICIEAFELSSEDLPDAAWRSNFDAKNSPEDAITNAIDEVWMHELDPDIDQVWSAWLARGIPYG